MAARVVMVLLAGLASAWIAVLIRDHRVGEDASNRIFSTQRQGPAAFDRDIRTLHDAQLLNPDRRWNLIAAQYLQGAGRPRRAIVAARGYLEHEPANVAAWKVIYLSARERDPVAARAALAAVRRLDPFGYEALR